MSSSTANVNPNAGVGAGTNAPTGTTGVAEAYPERASDIRNLSWGYVKERASRMLDQLENRVSPTVFKGLVAGCVGGVLGMIPSMFMMLFKFKTWQDYFIGYFLFSLAAAGNALFSEKGTPKELLILAGIAVHFAVSFAYGVLMARWTESVRDTPTIILRSVLLSIGMHYANLVFIPKVWKMPLLCDYLDYTGFFPHLLDHLAFGLTVGSTLAALRTMRGRGLAGIRSTTGGLLTSLANNADRLRSEVTGKVQEAAHAIAPGSSTTTTTSTTGTGGNAPSTSTTSGLPSVNQIRSAVEHAVGSAKDTVTSAVNQQIPSTAGKGDTFKSGGTTASSTTTTAPSSSTSSGITPPARAPYLDAATSGTPQYTPKDTGFKPEESSANPVPSTAEKKRM